MTLTNEDRFNILNFLLERLSNISDKEYQKRIWVEGKGPEMDFFEDAACDFFQEAEGILECYDAFGLTKEQYQALKTFSDKFHIFSRANDFPRFFIDTPEWDEITKMAKEVLKIFNCPPKK